MIAILSNYEDFVQGYKTQNDPEMFALSFSFTDNSFVQNDEIEIISIFSDERDDDNGEYNDDKSQSKPEFDICSTL